MATTHPGDTVSSTDATPSSERSTTTAPDEESIDLPQTGGCADAYFWAASADGTQALTVYVDVRDRSGTEPTELDLTLPDPLATVTLQRGSDLTQAFCNDVLDQDYELDEEVPVVEGTLHLTVDPTPRRGGWLRERHRRAHRPRRRGRHPHRRPRRSPPT